MPVQGGILAKRSKTVKLSNIQNFTRDMKNVTRLTTWKVELVENRIPTNRRDFVLMLNLVLLWVF